MPVSHTGPQRKPTRLKEFDYSAPGAYFVTMVAYDRKELLGVIENGQMNLFVEGELVRQAWFDLPHHYANVCLGEEDFVIMPNHVHGIVVLSDVAFSSVGEGLDKGKIHVINQPDPPRRQSGSDLTEIMRAFKSFSARRINLHQGISGVPVWQRSFYEHILRDEGEWDRARKYILQNPQNWQDDQENSKRIGTGSRADSRGGDTRPTVTRVRVMVKIYVVKEQIPYDGGCDWPGGVWVEVKFGSLMGQTLPYGNGNRLVGKEKNDQISH